MKNYNLKMAKMMQSVCSNDTDGFCRKVIQWHFSPETGTELWLGLRESLSFDPVSSIKNFRDLHQFSNISFGLCNVPAEQLIPRGIPKELSRRIIEVGGKMDAKKHIIVYDEWINMLITWRMSGYQHRPGRPAGNTLSTIPVDSAFLAEIYRKRAERLGGQLFSISYETREYGVTCEKGDATVVDRSVENIFEEIHNIFISEDIRFLVTKPTLFREMLRRPEIVSEMKRSLAQVTLDGTEIDLEALKDISCDILPGCEFSASYSNASTLNVSRSLLITTDSEHVVYESFSPFITYNVIDNNTLQPVNYGERGRVTVTHLSPYAFFPHVVDNVTAIRLPGLSNLAGDRLADIKPLC